MAKNKTLERKRKRLYRTLGQFMSDFESKQAQKLTKQIWEVEAALKIPVYKRISL